MKLLVIQGHPDSESFTHVNAMNYIESAKAAGHEVTVIDLSDTDFNPNLAFGYRQHMADESVSNRFQKLIKESDHLAFFFPVWWGAEPALLKGFLDRTLTPGFAYHYQSPTKIDQLLKGKTADLFITSRGPAWFTKSLFGSVVYRWKRLVLGFTGIKVKKVLVMGNMNTKKSSERKRKDFINRCADTVK
ncbi:NAD(P)H-dependent oxidoreductase [Fructobacillus sp. CRL 2054]|uniref:NAD(P)H-dependent oxidoreductase n=1 Tax=Fructobacillus sp. CRL 2054 TaxID=2763007 RepID=UPI002379628E|nr:NAD(P)H-dependent oxidoreductase [Fructobacillus sp. CRL 2054]MDD9138838.1 NAD(P)H-dependent oxidoreductase [Fructobacillus sp. CRL 2054]